MSNALSLHPIATSGLSMGDRTRQEDALAVAMPEGHDIGFAVLSDGMGGHAAGDLASHLIVSEVFAELSVKCRSIDPETLDIPVLLRHAVSVANESLRAHVTSRPDERGMGGTLVVIAVWQGHLYWASVGDSLLYLYRDGTLRRLNADHSMAPQLDLMVAKGLMTAETAANHPQRSCLTAAILGEDIAELDCPETPLDLALGDCVIVASDGLLSLGEEDLTDVIETARADGSRAMTRALLSAVDGVCGPEQDNTSLVVVEIAAATVAGQTQAGRLGILPFLARTFGGRAAANHRPNP